MPFGCLVSSRGCEDIATEWKETSVNRDIGHIDNIKFELSLRGAFAVRLWFIFVRLFERQFRSVCESNYIEASCVVCVFILFHKTRKEEWNTLEGFFLAMFILDLFASQMGTVSGQSLRISFYFGSFQILGLPYFVYYEKKRRTILTALLIGYLCIYWYVYYVIYGYSSIYPYEAVRLY